MIRRVYRRSVRFYVWDPYWHPSKDPTFTPLIYIQVLRTDYVTIPENKRDDIINKNHKIRLLSKPNTVNKTYQLQSTPHRRNFNPTNSPQKKKNKGTGEGKEKGLSTSASVLLLKDTFNQFKLMRQHRDPRLKPRTET
ncbi:hypothetical protein Avbf_07858 [Armadillidium vulgare]|nr:hypothetical protein Avbf_07858 [Armadillidium vulgare]